MTKQQINNFFSRPGINKAGICREYGMSQRYLNSMLNTHKAISKPYMEKIKAAMNSYGTYVVNVDGGSVTYGTPGAEYFHTGKAYTINDAAKSLQQSAEILKKTLGKCPSQRDISA